MVRRAHRVIVKIMKVLEARKKPRGSRLLAQFSGADQLTVGLEPTEVSVMLPSHQTSFSIDLLKVPVDVSAAEAPQAATAVTTWKVSIEDLQPMSRHEVRTPIPSHSHPNPQVLLRGQGNVWPQNVAAHVALVLVPIGEGSAPSRRPGERALSYDAQGFTVREPRVLPILIRSL